MIPKPRDMYYPVELGEKIVTREVLWEEAGNKGKNNWDFKDNFFHLIWVLHILKWLSPLLL